MRYAWKIDAVLTGIGSGITVCDVDGDAVVIAVRDVDIVSSSCSGGGSAVGDAVVRYVIIAVIGNIVIVSVDFDIDVCVVHIIVKDSAGGISSATPVNSVPTNSPKPCSTNITAAFEASVFDVAVALRTVIV